MLLELITILGLKIIFIQELITCGSINYASGCFEENKIVLSYQARDINRLFYHELGHAIFENNFDAHNIIKDYKYDQDEFIYSVFDNSSEKLANYFSEYMVNNKEFSVKYPCLYIFFRDSINNLLK